MRKAREAKSQKAEVHNLEDPPDGLFRDVAAGVTTRIFAEQHAILLVTALASHLGVVHIRLAGNLF